MDTSIIEKYYNNKFKKKRLLEYSSFEDFFNDNHDYIYTHNLNYIYWYPNEFFNIACNKHDFSLIKKSVLLGADINLNNGSVILYAASSGNLDLLRFLLSNGADINSYYKNIISCAAINGHTHICKYLIKEYPDIYIKCDSEFIRAISNGRRDIVQLILEYNNIIGYVLN